MNIAKSLRLAMVHSELTQKELADKTGITAATLSNISLDKTSPSVRTVHCIADATGFSVSEFIELGEE